MNRSIFLILILLLPITSAIQISEIMYNLEGKDDGLEWVEVHNDGEDIDFCTYKFYEAETHHKINSEICTVEPEEYFIIADKPANLNFDCNLFDSAFSLSNSGEELCIRDANKEDIFCVIYTSEMGASGDGNSLQFVEDSWCVGKPTPGKINSCFNEVEMDIPEVEASVPEAEDIPTIEPLVVTESVATEIKEKPKKLETAPVKIEMINANNEIPQITGRVVYESNAQKYENLPILLLLTVSITLNVVFLFSSIRKE